MLAEYNGYIASGWITDRGVASGGAGWGTTHGLDVVYDGANENYKPIQEKEIINTRTKHSAGCPYFLFIGIITSP